ncbi:MAG TPA: hypothetical protein VFF69_14000 [Phycisphaerales bacterium]|nr:hypothetical protein [Phycisphaerales bacterium]
MDPNRGQNRAGPADAIPRGRSAFLTAVRMAFLILMLTVTLLTIIRTESKNPDASFFQRWWLPIGAAAVLSFAFLAADLLTPRKKISTLSGVMLGLVAGLLAAIALGFVIDLVAESWDLTHVPRIVGLTKILVGIAMCYLGISTILQTQDDFRLVIPYVEFAKQMRGVRPLLLDTSALIDARIVEVAETGISQAPIIIPQFVVAELQRLADSADRMKRTRGRRGLEIVARLQRSPLLDVSIDETPMPSKAVDHMLVDLARQLPAVIVTTDVGLRQVAGIHGVVVLNLNDLANALKPNLIPGEQLTLELLRRGEQRSQAVGYLPDGTMVVAEDGAEHIGREVSLTVTSSLQTSAGRMIFGRIDADGAAESPARIDAAHESVPPAERGGAAGARADTPGEPSAPGPAGPELESADAAPPRGPFPPRQPARPNRARNPRR